MHWRIFRRIPWLDTRAAFVVRIPNGGSLLDLGASDGETLRHFTELRPDLCFHAVDLHDDPGNYPKGCQFHRADLEGDSLPWKSETMDAITCMHLVEHLTDLKNLFTETARLLKPDAKVYFETPHPKTVTLPSPKGCRKVTFTMNFYDDLTHIRPVSVGALAQHAKRVGLEVVSSGISRNWLFAAAHPLLMFARPSRKKYTAQIHWIGWSAYLIAKRPVQ